jgi:UDP-N-acetylmuramoylalanine--D-glutamate ligase
MKSSAAHAFFSGKKITLMGLGLLGRGLGDAKFLAAAGAKLIVTDLKTEAELASSVAELADTPGAKNITLHLGGHHLEDFENRDLIIKAPNTPLDSPFIAHARSQGIPVEMDAALFVKLAMKITATAGTAATARAGVTATDRPALTIVGVTGTRGKSTVTHLIYEMVRAAGRTTYLGGNVKDTATLPLIEMAKPGDVVVLELDSWQLQGFEEDRISPNIAIWTNFMPDHMNYYRGDMNRYFVDKAAIARFQKVGDAFIAPLDIKSDMEKQLGTLTGKYINPLVTASEISAWEIALPGEHNRANAACAVAAARAIGIPDEVIKKVLKDFHSLPNRLELLGEKNGIAFYNDSNATTPDATIVALRTLHETGGKPVILIAGGNDKELAFEELAKEIAPSASDAGEKNLQTKPVKKLILFTGKASEKLKACLPADFVANITTATDMKTAVDAALAAAASGDIILLSPAATSFGLFKNEYDRGEQFRKIVDNIGTL